MRLLIPLIVTLGLGFFCIGIGCQPHKDSEGPMSSEEADKLNAKHSPFEDAKDPAFSANTHFATGQLAEEQGGYAKAAEHYNAALKLEPKHLASLYRLGTLYARVQDYPHAIETWQRYVEATDGSAEAFSNLGFCYELSGDGPRAEAAYKQGIAKDPHDKACRVKYGLHLTRAGRESEALMQFQAVLTPAQAHYNLASVYEDQGRMDRAKTEYQKAVSLDPNLQAAKVRLAALIGEK